MELANRAIMTMQNYKPFNKLDAVSAAEEWSADERYVTGEFVVYKGRLYECTADSSTQGTWVSSEWTAVILTHLIEENAQLRTTTWQELKSDRDQGQLVPGAQYRITDYRARVKSYGTGSDYVRSMSHPFDLIVTADSPNKLSEVARAIRHTGDSYFPEETNFEAWKVWYCLDNDTARFKWALNIFSIGTDFFIRNRISDEVGAAAPYCWISESTPFSYRWTASEIPAQDDVCWTNYDKTGTESSISGVNIGFGVIYRLIDEFNNDAPYDFKGIQFKAYGDTASLGSKVWRYTFDSGEASGNTDVSLTGAIHDVYGNKISPLVQHADGQQACQHLNDIVCLGSNCKSNEFAANCKEITIGNGSSYNTFGCGCTNAIFGEHCSANALGDECHHIVFGASASERKSYMRYITVEGGNSYIYLNPTGNTSISTPYRNVTIKAGVNNPTNSSYKTIVDANIGQTFNTTYQPANSRSIEIPAS